MHSRSGTICKIFSRVLFVLVITCCFCLNTRSQHKREAFQIKEIKPVLVVEKDRGHYFIDFGKDVFGTLTLMLKSRQQDSLVILLGEKLTDVHTIDKKPGGTIRYQQVVLHDLPVNERIDVPLVPDKRNSTPPAVLLPDSFGVIMPFRYAEILNVNVPIADLIVHQKVFSWRFDESASAFTSSDTVLNQVWEMCKHTIKATSFCGVYVDGDRERIPYEADALINQLSHYAIEAEYEIARRTNEYFISHPTWPTEWILHTVPLFYYDYLYTGDLSSIAKHYQALKAKTLVSLARADGLISTKSTQLTDSVMKQTGFQNTRDRIRDIVDWPEKERDGYEMAAVNTVVNAFHYLNMKLMSEFAGRLDKKADSVYFYKQSLLVKQSINEKLFDVARGVYVDGEGSQHSSLHANVFALAFGIVPQDRVEKVVTFVKSRKMACSVYAAQYLLEALYQYGEADYALSLMSATEGDRNWWNMIRVGSTMALEAWDIKYKPNLDWNHAWGTAPANIITRYLWGITPSRPGFEKVRIRPQLSTLAWSTIKVPTIKGAIVAEYKVVNKKQTRYLIELPQGMEAEFVLPPDEKLKVRLNKKVVKQKDILMLIGGRHVVEIGR